jgi:hypothetical protein
MGTRPNVGLTYQIIDDRKIAARLPRRCPRQVERRIIADYSNFTKSSAFTATGQLATRAALVNANWRGWHLAEPHRLRRFLIGDTLKGLLR